MNGNQNDSNINGLTNGNTMATANGSGTSNNVNGVPTVNNSFNSGVVSGGGSTSVSVSSSGVVSPTSVSNPLPGAPANSQVGSGTLNNGGVIGNFTSQQVGNVMPVNNSLQGATGFQVNNSTNINNNGSINTNLDSNPNPNIVGNVSTTGTGFVQPPLVNGNVSAGVTSFGEGIESDAVVDENLKRVEINSGPSKARTVFTILLFVFTRYY